MYADSRFDFEFIEWPSEEVRKQVTQQQFDAQRTDYRKRFPNSRHEIILFDESSEEKRVGRVWTAYLEDHIHVLDINILSEYRNRGIGTHIFRERQEEASSSACTLRHYVHRENRQALRFYRRLDFTIVKDIQTHVLMEWTPGGSPSD